MSLATISNTIDDFAPPRTDELTNVVFWSVAVAAEPICVSTLYEMHGAKSGERGRIDDSIQKLIDGGLVQMAGSTRKYVINEAWWYDLKAFGGIYDH